MNRVAEVLWVALRLGLTSFGGPIAHLGHFERVYVRERRWLTGEQFTGLVALTQLLPGPSSSQAGLLIGWHRAGAWGAVAAWIGFTLPSALLMYACAVTAADLRGPLGAAVLQGLKLVAVTVVAQAVWLMARRACATLPSGLIAAAATLLAVGLTGPAAQLLVIALGAAAGAALCRHQRVPIIADLINVPTGVGWSAVALFAALLVGLPIVAALSGYEYLGLANAFYRSGALVFGGGHVVLPLLHDALVPAGWIADAEFLTGYGLAQAMPGPLFSVAAYLGAASPQVAEPALGATIALIALFLPGMLLAVAGATLWRWLLQHPGADAALTGVNAAVVGLLASALYDPVWVTAVHSPLDASIALVGIAMLQRWSISPIVVVAWCVGASVVRWLLS